VNFERDTVFIYEESHRDIESMFSTMESVSAATYMAFAKIRLRDWISTSTAKQLSIGASATGGIAFTQKSTSG
jgi:hypothetical protein